jgi:hypothetical protein
MAAHERGARGWEMSTRSAAPATTGSRARRIALYVSAGLVGGALAVLAVVVLVEGLSDARTVHRVHDLAVAIILALLAAGFLGTLLTRGRAEAPLQQVLVLFTVLFVVDAVTARLGPALLVSAALVVPVALLHPRRSALLTVRRPSPLLAGGWLLAAAPLLWYALGQIALQRAAHSAEPHAYPEGHYAGMATMALAFVALGLLASLRGPGWRVPAWSAGLGLALFGVASMATPLLLGAAPAPYGILAVFAGVALVALAELERRAGGAIPTSSDVDDPSTQPAL